MTRTDRPRRCGRCGKPLVWHETPRGVHQALDLKPVLDGPVVLERARSESGVVFGRLRARTLKKDELPPFGADRYMPHSATCAALQEAAG